MKKVAGLFLGLFLSLPAWAEINLEPLLNKVSLQLQAEQWVTTKTALLSVGINASVSDQGIEKIQNEVMQKLNQLSSKGEWHIVSFDRQLDKSGLESIQMMAQVRLPQTDLANLRDKAKAISKPGETFTIDNVQFTPSNEEVRQAEMNLRNNLYSQAKTEIDNLNKLYPEQKYYLHQINFISSPVEPAPMLMSNEMVQNAVARTTRAPALSVGGKQVMQATVVLASMPDQVAQKLTHS